MRRGARLVYPKRDWKGAALLFAGVRVLFSAWQPPKKCERGRGAPHPRFSDKVSEPRCVRQPRRRRFAWRAAAPSDPFQDFPSHPFERLRKIGALFHSNPLIINLFQPLSSLIRSLQDFRLVVESSKVRELEETGEMGEAR